MTVCIMKPYGANTQPFLKRFEISKLFDMLFSTLTFACIHSCKPLRRLTKPPGIPIFPNNFQAASQFTESKAFFKSKNNHWTLSSFSKHFSITSCATKKFHPRYFYLVWNKTVTPLKYSLQIIRLSWPIYRSIDFQPQTTTLYLCNYHIN